MHFNKRKYLAAILSMAFAMSLLLNSFSVQTFALDSLAEHEGSAQEQEGEMSVPAQDEASQPQAAAEDLTEQDEAQLQLKMQIADLLEQSAQVGQMTEQELETVQEQIQAVTVQPLAQQEEAEPDLELETMLEQLANAQAAVEDMSMAYQAQREGWLDQLPQTGKENSWRYQNGERLEQNAPAEIMTLSLTEGVTVFNSNGYWGIDVSHHQGEVNWEAVKAAGIDFAVIRCGYGDDLVSQDDRQWHRNVSECERLGIPYGVYLYSYATDTNMAASEAAHTLRLLEGHNPDLPVFYDMEENRQLVLGASGLAELARTYCDTLVAAGYDVGVYASLNWWQYYLTDSVFENWHRWVAEWRSSCTYTGRYEMWQYTDCGTINGINGYVDMNYWYGTAPQEFIKDGLYYDSSDNLWHYYKRGEGRVDYTGLAQAPSGRWCYVKNGVVDWSHTGLVQAPSGRWCYVKNGVVDWSHTGLVQAPSGRWCYVTDGVVNWSYTGLVWSFVTERWCYVSGGIVDWSYTGLATAPSGRLCYVANGVVDWSYTGLVWSAATEQWCYVVSGAVDWSYTGLATAPSGRWCYVENGVINWNYTGFHETKDGENYYVKNGVWQKDYLGLVWFDDKGKWLFIQGGKWDTEFEGLVKAPSGRLCYVNEGVIDWMYNGQAQTISGDWYMVENGVATEKVEA